MKKITAKIDGMMCGMCESHVNDCIRNNFTVKSVKSSHKTQEAVIIADDIDENALRSALENVGYKLLSLNKENYVKKGLFDFLKK